MPGESFTLSLCFRRRFISSSSSGVNLLSSKPLTLGLYKSQTRESISVNIVSYHLVTVAINITKLNNTNFREILYFFPC